MFKIIAAIYFNRSANEFLRDELFTLFTQFFRYFVQFYIKSNTYSLFSNRNVMAEVGLCPRNFNKENQVALIDVKYAWEFLESSILVWVFMVVNISFLVSVIAQTIFIFNILSLL